MFVRQNQQQFRNSNADVQIFYGFDTTGSTNAQSWTKPPGISHVYMMLIGNGGNGDGTTGGGSGSVTVWYGAAQNVPDSLQITVPRGNASINTLITYRNTSGTPTTLLTALRGNGITGGAATTANAFASSGFYQSVAGQDGATSLQFQSSTTFLSGGAAAGAGNVLRANYGYVNVNNENGFFMLQPIIVGIGSMSTVSGVGCGGSATGNGGQGMVLIASW